MFQLLLQVWVQRKIVLDTDYNKKLTKVQSVKPQRSTNITIDDAPEDPLQDELLYPETPTFWNLFKDSVHFSTAGTINSQDSTFDANDDFRENTKDPLSSLLKSRKDQRIAEKVGKGSKNTSSSSRGSNHASLQPPTNMEEERHKASLRRADAAARHADAACAQAASTDMQTKLNILKEAKDLGISPERLKRKMRDLISNIFPSPTRNARTSPSPGSTEVFSPSPRDKGTTASRRILDKSPALLTANLQNDIYGASGSNIGECCAGPSCLHKDMELRASHTCQVCKGIVHILCCADCVTDAIDDNRTCKLCDM